MEPFSDREVRSRTNLRTLLSFVTLVLLLPASAPAESVVFEETFEGYSAPSNLVGQGGWQGLTNFGTASEMPVTEGVNLPGSHTLNPRAIAQADRIHQVGHALPPLSASEISTFRFRAYADGISINSGIALGENPVPGPEVVATEGFFGDYRVAWYSYASGWVFDLRGVAGIENANLTYLEKGLGEELELRIVIDGPARRVYGQMVTGEGTITTQSRTIPTAQIAALDAVAIFSDRHEAGREGFELDDLQLVTTPVDDGPPCGDVNGNGTLTAADALAVLRGAVGQPVDLMCAPPARVLGTGQVACFDVDGKKVDCEGSGQDGETQAGVRRAFFDNGDGTISDLSTGLVWEKLSDDGSVHDADTTWTWAAAVSGKIATLNAEGFGGADDWRLPTRFELESLADLGAVDPASFAIFSSSCAPGCSVTECSCDRSSTMWTSTTFAPVPADAWVVRFTDGSPLVYEKQPGEVMAVRAVRGGR